MQEKKLYYIIHFEFVLYQDFFDNELNKILCQKIQ